MQDENSTATLEQDGNEGCKELDLSHRPDSPCTRGTVAKILKTLDGETDLAAIEDQLSKIESRLDALESVKPSSTIQTEKKPKADSKK